MSDLLTVSEHMKLCSAYRFIFLKPNSFETKATRNLEVAVYLAKVDSVEKRDFTLPLDLTPLHTHR